MGSYNVAVANDLRELIEKVNSLCKVGYEPLGGVIIDTSERTETWYYQTVFRKGV